MPTSERRQAPRAPAYLLVALRRVEDGQVAWTGFARTINLSVLGALLETPDKFTVDQNLSLEFLLDEDQIARVEGVVVRVGKVKKMYHVAVAFSKPDAKTKRLLARQMKSTA